MVCLTFCQTRCQHSAGLTLYHLVLWMAAFITENLQHDNVKCLTVAIFKIITDLFMILK